MNDHKNVKQTLKSLLVGTALFAPLTCFSDAPTTDASWQWNRNVTIDKLYVYWDESVTRVVLDNGQVCYVQGDDQHLYAAVLAMHAQKASGEFVCQLANSFDFEGKTARRLHRLRVN